MTVPAVPARPPFWRAVGITLRACVSDARACAAISVVYAIVAAVPNAVFGALTPEVDLLQLTPAEAVALFAFLVAALGTLLLVGLLVYPAVLGALSLVGEAAVVGDAVELGTIARRAVDRALQATGAFVLVGALAFGPPVAVGILLVLASFATSSEAVFALALALPVALLVPAAYVIVRCSLAVPATMTEGLRPVEAVRRSWDLVRGGFWWTVGVFVATGAVAAAVGAVLAVIGSVIAALGVPEFGVATARNLLGGIVSVSILGVATGVVYAARSIPAADGAPVPAPGPPVPDEPSA